MSAERQSCLDEDKIPGNKGNGYRQVFKSGIGSRLQLQVPRDRLGLFKPVILGVLDQQEEQIKTFVSLIIKRDKSVLQYKDVEFARNKYNKNLKELAKLAGIQENLTSYVAKHNYASIADDMEVPLTVISQMLGHQKISTTQAYLSDIRKNRLDEYQDKVLKLID